MAGAACLLAAWIYRGGARPYGYLGLGEVFVFVFFGLVATCGTVYVEVLHVTPLAVLAGCALGFLASAILVLNNLRDIDTDAAAGKRTLATRIGRTQTRRLLLAITAAAFAMPVAAAISQAGPPTVLFSLLAIPVAFPPLAFAFTSTGGPALVIALKRMAMTEMVFSLLFAMGVLVR